GAADRKLDLPGQVLAVLSLGGLAAALIEGGSLGWSNPWVLLGFLVSGFSAAAFVYVEQHTRQPMLPLQLFRNPTFSVTSANGLLMNIAIYGLIFVLSLYFQQVNGLTPLQTGLAFVAMLGAVFPANLAAARVAERFGARKTIVVGQLVGAAACLAMLG